MNKRSSVKLKLTRKTIKVLSDSQANRAIGGGSENNQSCIGSCVFECPTQYGWVCEWSKIACHTQPCSGGCPPVPPPPSWGQLGPCIP